MVQDGSDDKQAIVHGLVLGAPDVAPRQLQKAFDTVVRTRGGRPKEDAEGLSEGIEVEARFYVFESHGAWVLMQTRQVLPISLAHELAARVNKNIVAHVVAVIEGADGESWTTEQRSIEVTPEGAVMERTLSTDSPQTSAAHDSPEQAAEALLWTMLTDHDTYAPAGEPKQLAYILPSARTSNLPPRLAELATLIQESGKFSVQDVGGQTMLRLTLPDGSRRFSRVTSEELAQLRETTGIEPS